MCQCHMLFLLDILFMSHGADVSKTQTKIILDSIYHSLSKIKSVSVTKQLLLLKGDFVLFHLHSK